MEWSVPVVPSTAINQPVAGSQLSPHLLGKEVCQGFSLGELQQKWREITDVQNIWDGLKHVEDWVNSLGTGQFIRDIEYIDITY